MLERDRRRCRWCGEPVTGERGRDWSIHHRLPRRMGGTRRPGINSPANLVTVHGSGTTGCHGDIELSRAFAQGHGWLLCGECDDPAAWPILLDRESRWVYLTATGDVSDLPPGECTEAAHDRIEEGGSGGAQ
ncbi:MAG: HNH endonuclease [Haloechinothrix sp.]